MAFRMILGWTRLEVLGSYFRNPFRNRIDSTAGLWQSDNDDWTAIGEHAHKLCYGNMGLPGIWDLLTGASLEEVEELDGTTTLPKEHWPI